jgi:hypothetical protein
MRKFKQNSGSRQAKPPNVIDNMWRQENHYKSREKSEKP